MQSDVFEQLLVIFRDEAHEELDELRQLVGSLRSIDGSRFVEVIGTAMRISHNLKGASSSVGLEDMSQLAHVLEDVLLAMRDERLAVSREIGLDVAERAVNAMAQLVDGIPVDVPTAIANLVALIPNNDVSRNVPIEVASSTVVDSEASPNQALERASTEEPPPESTHETKQRGVRVNVDRLDDLVRYAGELLATHAEARERHEESIGLAEEIQALNADVDFEKHGAVLEWLGRLDTHVQREREGLRRLTRLTSELTESIRRMRMVPIAAFAATFRRCVSDAAQVTNRDAELQMHGGDVELDKQVLDRVVESILHLLRNAVDHGIEPPDERIRKGKPRRGRVLITTRLDKDLVELSVHDDGRGFDMQRLREVALVRGIRNKKQLEEMAETELVDLVFDTGFSTAQKLSTISGRGVGLDVVRRSVEEFGGRVEVLAPGRLGGTSFVLLLPVNILSVHALLIRSNHDTYAIPIDAVERTLRFRRSDVKTNGRDSVLEVAGQPLRLRSLASLLGKGIRQAPSLSRSDGIAVVLRRAGRILAVEVDEVIADQEYSIRRLPWNMQSVAGVSGLVALPDSQVAIALDATFLLRQSGEVLHGTPSAQAMTKFRILVADDSLTARTLAKNALTAAGYSVTAVVDGLKAWQALFEEDFALLVSDVRMPNLDGIELTRRVRGHERLKTLPIVLITTESTPEDIQRGLSVGADEYVIKGPMQQQKLLEAVARHL